MAAMAQVLRVRLIRARLRPPGSSRSQGKIMPFVKKQLVKPTVGGRRSAAAKAGATRAACTAEMAPGPLNKLLTEATTPDTATSQMVSPGELFGQLMGVGVLGSVLFGRVNKNSKIP